MSQSIQYRNHTRSVWVTGLFLLLLSSYASRGQNLVPNPSFEDYDYCPFPVDDDGPMSCAPWISTYSCNYFNECNPGPAGVPENFQGYQYAHTGVAYAGGYADNGENGGSGEFLQVPLLEPLIAGECYEVSFWANLSNESCGINYLGAAFSEELGGWPGFLIPRLDGFYEYYSDTSDWMLIQGTMIAFGGEAYLTLGNFHTDEETELDPDCPPEYWFTYYYFDDVSVVHMPTDHYNVDLGGPIESCFPVTLDPGIDGATFLWSDGSTGPTLTVEESGTYSVVVTLGECYGGVASVEVTILEHSYVSLPDDTTLCAGDQFMIDLDESLGMYEWQDGSTEADYTISGPGLYTVTLNDGCVESTDQIEVFGQDIPLFSLGEDSLLCEGDHIQFNLDPGLGDFIWQDFSTNPFYTINAPGLYALTISNQCGVHADSLEVIDISPPIVELGSPTDILCPGGSISFSLDPDQGDYLWQDGSTSPDYTISAEGIYSVTVTNQCGEAVDLVSVEALEPPLVDFGIDSLFLCPWQSTWIGVTGVEGDYMWNTGATDPSIQISSSGLYSLTVTNACGVDSSQVVVVAPPAVVPPDLGPDLVLCDGQPFALTVSQQDVNILWNDTLNSPSISVSETGTYFVEVSTSCESFSDTIFIVFENNAPVPDLPDQINICDGESVVLDPGVTGADFLWSDGSQLSFLEVSAPGTYAVTVSSLCGTASDSVLVVSNGIDPMGILPGDTIICSGDSVLLTPDIVNADTWLWSDGSTDSVLWVTEPGQVYLEVSNVCATRIDSVLIGVVPDIPDFSLGMDTTVCPGEAIHLSVGVPDVDILWPDGSQTADYTTVDSGEVIVTLANGCILTSDTLHVFWNPPIPALVLPDSLALCPGEVITISPGIPDVDYEWHDGSNAPEYVVDQPGIVGLTISDECDSSEDSTIIYTSNQGPVLDLGADITVCEGEVVTLAAGISGVSYFWQDGSTSSSYTVSQSGTYSVTVENACGIAADSVSVLVSGNPPSTDLGNDTTLCAGEIIILSGTPIQGIVYAWQDGSSLSSFEVVEEGIYILTESNACGSASDTIEVAYIDTPIPLSLGPDTVLCSGDILLLSVDASLESEVEWQDGSNGSSYAVSQTGVYSVVVSNECGEVMDTIEIFYESPPTPFDLGPDTVICPDARLILQPPIQSGEYLWQDGSGATEYVVENPGIYSLIVSNSCGETTDEVQIEFEEAPPFALDTSIQFACDDEVVFLSAVQSFEATYTWNTGQVIPDIEVIGPGAYSVLISTDCYSRNFQIDVQPEPDCVEPVFFFPNVFSPNQDLVNDFAELSWNREVEVTTTHGEVFSRWGELLFASDQMPFSWDGTMRGETLNPGVYVYRIQVTYNTSTGEKTQILVGDITLLK